MPTCSVYGCKTRSGTGPTLYTFPNRERSPVRFRKWCDRTNRKNFSPGTHAYICSKHFLDSDFNESDILRAQLMPHYRHKAPSLKPGTVPHHSGIASSSSYLAKTSRDARHQKRLNKRMVEELLNNSATKPCTSTKPSAPTGICSTSSSVFEPHITIDVVEVQEPFKDTGSQVELGTEMMRGVTGNLFYREFSTGSSQVELGQEIMRRFGDIKSEPEVFF